MPRVRKPKEFKDQVQLEESDTENDRVYDDIAPPQASSADLRLPETTVIKMMKEELPRNAVISQEAKDCMRRMPTIFALYITDLALQIARQCKRRTILPEDVVEALEESDFDSFAEKVIPLVEKRKANYRRKPEDGEIGETSGEPADEPMPPVDSTATATPSTLPVPSQQNGSRESTIDDDDDNSTAPSETGKSSSSEGDDEAADENSQDVQIAEMEDGNS